LTAEAQSSGKLSGGSLIATSSGVKVVDGSCNFTVYAKIVHAGK